jgi:TetR/AcrR family transcriptional regulator, cmeABC operon repressor
MTSQQIKQAALKLFAEKGYEGTPLSAIAKAVGIKTPSLYAHFPSKEELFLSIFRDTVSLELLTIKEALDDQRSGNASDTIRAIFDALTEMREENENIQFFKRAIFFPPAGLGPKLKEDFYEYEKHSTDMLQGLFEHGLKESMFTAAGSGEMAAAFYCLIDGLLVEQHYYSLEEYEKRRESAWKIFLAGISMRKEG